MGNLDLIIIWLKQNSGEKRNILGYKNIRSFKCYYVNLLKISSLIIKLTF